MANLEPHRSALSGAIQMPVGPAGPHEENQGNHLRVYAVLGMALKPRVEERLQGWYVLTINF
jgi:hypothetical protein